MFKLVLATLAVGGAVLGTVFATLPPGGSRSGTKEASRAEWEKELRSRVLAPLPKATPTTPVAAKSDQDKANRSDDRKKAGVPKKRKKRKSRR